MKSALPLQIEKSDVFYINLKRKLTKKIVPDFFGFLGVLQQAPGPCTPGARLALFLEKSKGMQIGKALFFEKNRGMQIGGALLLEKNGGMQIGGARLLEKSKGMQIGGPLFLEKNGGMQIGRALFF